MYNSGRSVTVQLRAPSAVNAGAQCHGKMIEAVRKCRGAMPRLNAGAQCQGKVLAVTMEVLDCLQDQLTMEVLDCLQDQLNRGLEYPSATLVRIKVNRIFQRNPGKDKIKQNIPAQPW